MINKVVTFVIAAPQAVSSITTGIFTTNNIAYSVDSMISEFATNGGVTPTL